MGNEASQEGGMPPGQAGQPGGQYPPGAFPPPQQMRPPQQGPTMGAQQRPMQGGPMGMGQQRPMMAGPMGPSVGQQRPAMIGMGPGQQRPMLGGPAGATQQQRPMLGGMAGPGTPQQRSMMGGPTMSQQRGTTPSAVPPGGQPPPDVDLSNLSEEEKEMILSVMARAQDMDQDLSQQKRPIEQQRQDTTGRQVAPAQQDQRRQICPVCRAAEITNETSAKCNDCGKTSCQRCGTFMPGLDGKRPTWICIECTRRRQPYAQQTARIQEQQMRQQERTRMSGDIEAARLQQQQQQHQLQQQPQHPFQQQASGMQAAIRAGSLQQQQSYQGQPMMDRITTQQQAITGSGLYAGPDSMMTSQAKMADGGRREDAKSRVGQAYQRTPSSGQQIIQVSVTDDKKRALSQVQQSGVTGEVGYQRGVNGTDNNRLQQKAVTTSVTATTFQQQANVAQTIISTSPQLGMQSRYTNFVQTSASATTTAQSTEAKKATSAVTAIPRTVPLMSVNQTSQQQPQQPVPTTQQQANSGLSSPKQKPKSIDLQAQKKQKSKPDPQDWSPVTDLSPIMDVSPSIEAAEQELMEQFREKTEEEMVRTVVQANIPRATSGTISGMLADFNKALGLAGTSPVDEGQARYGTASEPSIQPQVQTSAMVMMSTEMPMDQNQNILQQQHYQQQIQQQQQQQQPWQQQQLHQFQQTSQAYQQQPPQWQQQSQQQQQMMQQQQQQQQQQQLMQQQQLQQLQQQVQQQQQQEQIQLQQQQQQLQSQVPQTQTQRRIHRRLPQPTMEQMQAAVAMAAQSPRGKSVSQTRASTSQPISMGMTSVSTGVTQRSVSPSIPQRTTDLSSTTLGQTTQQVSSLQTDATWMQQVSVGDQTGRQYVLTGSGTAAATILTPALPMSTVVTATVASSSLTPQPNGQYLQAVQMQPAVSPIHGEEQGSRTRSTGIGGTSPVPGYGKSMTPVTPQTPSTPRDKGDSSDTLSEADSLKMGKVRRKLPPLPQDQEPSSIPTRRAKDRMRTLSSGATPLTQQERSKSPFHTSSLDGGITMTPSNISDVIISTSPRQSASESYLQMISSGRTLGLSEGSSLMGRRDLSAPHNLSSYLRDSSSMTGTKLPSYIKSLGQQLRGELKSVTEDRRRILDRDPYYRRSETDLSSLLSHSWPEDRYDTLSHRKLLHSSSPAGLLLPTSTRWQSSPRTSPQPSPRRIRHRRHASDPKVPLFSPIKEDRDSELDLGMQGYLKHPVGQPFKSFEFESIDDRLGGDGLLRSSRYGGSLGSGLASKFYQRGSSLSDIRFGEDTDYSQLPLRDTGFFDSDPDEYYRRYAREMMRYRRPSDGSLYTPPSLRAGLDPWDRSSSSYFLSADRKKRKDRKPRKPRSWHPSPYVSEDEDDQTSREKRKAKIKAEIARRRHQIQENARLHEELYKLARMRDGSEKRAPYGASSVVGADHAGYSAPVDAIPRSIAEGYGSTGSSSVLQAIDEILRRDVYGSYPRRLGYESYGSKQSSMYTTAPSSYTTLPRSRYDYLSSMKNWYGDASSPSTQFPDTTAEDKSIARIASTFQHESRTPPELHLSVPFDPMSDFSPMTTDTETPTEIDPTPAMPLLPDMPTRSRKILEDLGSSPIVSQHGRSGHQASYREYMEVDRPGHSGLVSNDRMVDPVSVASRQTRKPQASSVPKATQKYHFPIKRILLTRDPKDRSVSGNGLGMKVIGGKDIPGSNGLIGAYVARIYPGGVVETLGEVKEGDQVLEWNGIPLTGKTYEDVQRIIASSGDEVEIVIRSDFNMLDPYASFQQRGRSPRLEQDRGGAGAGQGAVRSSQDSSRSGSKNPHYGSPSRGRESPHGTSRRGNPSPYDSDRPNHEYSSSNRNPNSTSHVGGLTSDYRYGANQHPPPNNPSWTTSHPPNSKNDNMNDSNKAKYRAENITGEIQLQICYDAKAAILYVTIVRARELVTTRDNSGLPDPFVRCYLLPGRCMENQRRTRYFSRCSNPEWKQTMVYPNVPLDTLKKRQLEISVWNYDIYRPNEFLGEVTLDLSVDSIIDEQARWYKLQDHHRIGSGPNPSSSLGQISDVSNGSGKKMARLNNPGNKEDLRKAVSNQAHRLSLFSPNNMSTHPLVAQGCHAAVCNIL